MLRTYFDLLRRRPAFRRLWLAELVSLLGDWLSYVAVSVLVAERSGGTGALAVAGVLVAHTLPQVALSPFAGVLADRMDRKRLLVLAHVVQAGLTLLMAAAAVAGLLWALPLLLAVRTAVVAFDVPARGAVLRRTVSESELLSANALSGATWSAAFAIGMALAGLASLAGPVPALLIDAATFGLAAVLLAPLPAMEPERAPRRTGLVAAAWTDVREALALSTRRADVMRGVFAKVPFAIAAGGTLVVLALVATGVPFAGAAGLTYGLLQTAKGVGTGVGPIAAEIAVRRGLSARLTWHVVAVVGFAGIAAFGHASTALVWFVASFVWGLGTGGNWVLASSELQRVAPDEAIGRLGALDNLSFCLALSLAALGAGALIEATGSHRIGAWASVAVGFGAWVSLELAGRCAGARPVEPAPTI